MKLPELAALLEQFLAWINAGNFKIKPRSGARLIPLLLNPHQMQIWRAMYRQAMAGEPVRVIVLKFRKAGCSTLVEALGYFLTKYVPHWRTVVIAHEADSTNEIFQISKRGYQNDPRRIESLKAGNRRELSYHHDSQFATLTAGGHFAGSGSTINMLHCSELAKWPNDMIGIADQLASVMQAVPGDPSSIVVIESTANRKDVSGEFEQRFRDAFAGMSSYAAVFTGWAEEESNAVPLRDGETLAYDDYEQKARALHGLTDAQLNWRRKKKRDDYAGSDTLFQQDYPLTHDEAFQVTEGKIFPMLRADIHGKSIPLNELMGAELYRGIDWGGRHPFVCVWVAHRPGQPSFTVDTQACPNIWKALTSWSYDIKERGGAKPQEKHKDANDAIRYAVMGGTLTGWVHVYREIYMPNSAYRGYSDLDLYELIERQSGSEQYTNTIADRSRPNTILMFSQRGMAIQGCAPPELTIAGEIDDGIAVMQALMQGTQPFLRPPPPETRIEQAVRLQLERGDLRYGEPDAELAMAVRENKRHSASMRHPFLGACW